MLVREVWVGLFCCCCFERWQRLVFIVSQGLSVVGKFLWTSSNSNTSLENSDNGQLPEDSQMLTPKHKGQKTAPPKKQDGDQVGVSRFEILELRL